MRVIRYENTVPMRWKNGLGQSRLITRSGNDDETFDWQVSLATMMGELPFSEYPGVDRSLCVIRGTDLIVAAGDTHLSLTPLSEPWHFPGELPVIGRTSGMNGMDDFNVLTRRTFGNHSTNRFSLAKPISSPMSADLLIVFVQEGEAMVYYGDESTVLRERDTAIIAKSNPPEYEIQPLQYSVCITSAVWRAEHC